MFTNSGETAGEALSDAIAKVYDALMDAELWEGTVRRVRPGARTAVDFIAGEEAAETIGMCAGHLTIEYVSRAGLRRHLQKHSGHNLT